MFLKKVEISGFKSFASKTTLEFLNSCKTENDKSDNVASVGICGITAIVGPNGSGKSNVADAIRWVMGEQSMKNLRGKKSEDIIFAGSGKKARLGSAHASLFFDNSDKRIPLEFSEVSITRKIFRSGESEYLINGSRVRLQDIVDLLAKAGIGRESYSIINQGMADAVLNATPLERRTIIEDAAGVKQYQIKKERSLRKLESARENLDKAKSLAEEIKPHLKTLKRQAEKAAQGKEIFAELKDKQKKLFSYLWNNFQNEKEKLNEAKDEMGRRMMNIQREVDKLSDEINKEAKENTINPELSELEKRRNDSRIKVNQMERELIVTEGRIEIEKEKQKSLRIIEEIKTQSISVDLPYVRKEIEDIQAEQEKLIKKIEEVKSLSELQGVKESARKIQQKLFELKADIEKGKKEEKSKPQIDTQEEKKISEADNAVIAGLQSRVVEIRKELQELNQSLAKLEQEIIVENQDERARRQKFFEVERSFRLKQDELGKMKDNFNESKIALARVEVHEEDLRSEVLKELKVEAATLERKDLAEEVNREVLEKDIARLKFQMEQIGGIDPLVVEEYEETNKRFDFLTNESIDLEQAIVSLREVIKEMEQKIDESFSKTFEEIEKEFTKYFRIIFGGGNANLKKVEVKKRIHKSKEDELAEIGEDGESGAEDSVENEKEKAEMGIDISACPPGKKISNLSMLSGGERSLTSLALLFAIIAHNPPPFAVLDEVEAALDEANSRRFGRILQELSGNTQFIAITHNRETMRQASLLYGVTMGEDGISKLLSVRLDQIGQGGKILK